MDISDIVAANREIELTHPKNDLPLGIHIELLPMDAKPVKIVERRIRDTIMKAQQKGKPIKSAEIEANEIELIMAAMVGWRWEADEARDVEQPKFDGEIPEFNPKNVRALLRKTWAREQIDAELGSVADFFEA